MKKLQRISRNVQELEEKLDEKRIELIDNLQPILEKIFGKFLRLNTYCPENGDGLYLTSKCSLDYDETKEITLPNKDTITIFDRDNGIDDIVCLGDTIKYFLEDHNIVISDATLLFITKEDAKKIRNALTNTLTEKSQEEEK